MGSAAGLPPPHLISFILRVIKAGGDCATSLAMAPNWSVVSEVWSLPPRRAPDLPFTPRARWFKQPENVDLGLTDVSSPRSSLQ